MKLGLSVFWLPYSDPQSKPIANLLTNVLIHIMLSSVCRNVNVLIEARLGIEAGPRIQAGGLT